MGFVQSADVVYLVSEDFAPYKLCRYAHDNWKLEAVNFSPKAAPPAGSGLGFTMCGLHRKKQVTETG